MCVQYWPKEGVAEMAINGFAVAVQSEQHFGDYVHRMLKVTEATVRENTGTHYSSWCTVCPLFCVHRKRLAPRG